MIFSFELSNDAAGYSNAAKRELSADPNFPSRIGSEAIVLRDRTIVLRGSRLVG